MQKGDGKCSHRRRILSVKFNFEKGRASAAKTRTKLRSLQRVGEKKKDIPRESEGGGRRTGVTITSPPSGRTHLEEKRRRGNIQPVGGQKIGSFIKARRHPQARETRRRDLKVPLP